MTLDYLPPQAYTKETLLKAYNWLQNQSEAVREMAVTPDHLVSLYLKAHRHGVEALERPSVQNFKSELKQLAGMMGDLEKKQDHSPHARPGGNTQPPPVSTPATTAGATSQPLSTTPAHQTSAAPLTSAVVCLDGLDELTLNMIREVKSELNLSSDVESLRMLVKIGYQKVRTLYK